MSYSFWRPQPWRPWALAPLPPLATPLLCRIGLYNAHISSSVIVILADI